MSRMGNNSAIRLKRPNLVVFNLRSALSFYPSHFHHVNVSPSVSHLSSTSLALIIVFFFFVCQTSHMFVACPVINSYFSSLAGATIPFLGGY